ncbi:MAG: glycosyltransferase [Flavobacteriaceae bacterium]|nr:glycosyltransferase [Flavobacteriaceae bacterium]
MMQLVNWFMEEEYEIIWASTAIRSEHSVQLDALNVRSHQIYLNDPSFDDLVAAEQPDVVLFDRFITEEQFGWRVAEHCPKAIRILDTEDLHFLRKARREAIREDRIFNKEDLYTETAKRELASILRCDLSLIISEVEMNLLIQEFKIPHGLLLYLPIWMKGLSNTETNALPKFSERKDFIHLGNFKHAPNLDAVIQLKRSIWPQIRNHIPTAKLHIYGAYAPQQIKEMHQPSEGFLVEGWAEDSRDVLSGSKVLLAPLRFGAGLKGKILNAMQNGTPTVTTAIGAEGISGDLPFGGFQEDSDSSFIEKAIALYENESIWQTAQDHGFDIIQKRFQRKAFTDLLNKRIEELYQNISSHRREHFMGQLLHHHTMTAHKYMSKWIEVKNKDIGS